MSQSGISNIASSSPTIPLVFQGNTGSGSAAANVFNIIGSSGTTTNVSGSTLTITGDGLGVTWSVIGASQALAVNNGYVCTTGAALSLSLPATSILGQVVQITLDGSTSFTVTQAAGQSIRFGNVSTTVGVGGSMVSTAQGDSIKMVCSVANTKWNVLSSVGNLTIV